MSQEKSGLVENVSTSELKYIPIIDFEVVPKSKHPEIEQGWVTRYILGLDKYGNDELVPQELTPRIPNIPNQQLWWFGKMCVVHDKAKEQITLLNSKTWKRWPKTVPIHWSYHDLDIIEIDLVPRGNTLVVVCISKGLKFTVEKHKRSGYDPFINAFKMYYSLDYLTGNKREIDMRQTQLSYIPSSTHWDVVVEWGTRFDMSKLFWSNIGKEFYLWKQNLGIIHRFPIQKKYETLKDKFPFDNVCVSKRLGDGTFEIYGKLTASNYYTYKIVESMCLYTLNLETKEFHKIVEAEPNMSNESNLAGEFYNISSQPCYYRYLGGRHHHLHIYGMLESLSEPYTLFPLLDDIRCRLIQGIHEISIKWFYLL